MNDVIPACKICVSVGMTDVNYDVDRSKDILRPPGSLRWPIAIDWRPSSSIVRRALKYSSHKKPLWCL